MKFTRVTSRSSVFLSMPNAENMRVTEHTGQGNFHCLRMPQGAEDAHDAHMRARQFSRITGRVSRFLSTEEAPPLAAP